MLLTTNACIANRKNCCSALTRGGMHAEDTRPRRPVARVAGHGATDRAAASQRVPLRNHLGLGTGKDRQRRSRSDFNVQHELRVPLPPTTLSDQTIFLFNGIQPSAANSNKAVLQPVLQWGNQDDPGGGQFWSVASWYVRGQPGALDVSARTKAVRVDPGSDLVAMISLTDNSNGVFSYLCEFSGIAGSALVVGLPTELVRVTTALECYRVVGDAELPASPSSSFCEITIDTKGNKRASPNWQVKNLAPADSHISATLVSHAGITDQVDITYR